MSKQKIICPKTEPFDTYSDYYAKIAFTIHSFRHEGMYHGKENKKKKNRKCVQKINSINSNAYITHEYIYIYIYIHD